jgi:hypothetical protein
MVIAPAKTGSESNRSRAVIPTDQTNKGVRSGVIPITRILIIVEIKLIAPRIEDTPAKCNEKIARSTDAPLCVKLLERGG